MADLEGRELIRIARERYGFNVVEAPPEELIESLRDGVRHALMAGRQRPAALLANWLAAIGRPAICNVAKPSDDYGLPARPWLRYGCTLPLGHDGDHERRTEKRVLTWPPRAADMSVVIAAYLKAVAAGEPGKPPRTNPMPYVPLGHLPVQMPIFPSAPF